MICPMYQTGICSVIKFDLAAWNSYNFDLCFVFLAGEKLDSDLFYI